MTEKVNVVVPKPRADLVIDKTKSRPWKGLCVHHSATLDGQARDWDAIRRFHKSYRVDSVVVSEAEFNRRLQSRQGTSFIRPWKDVAYHAGIEYVDGRLTFQWGRPLSEIGAHAGVKGCSNVYNTDFIGLAVVGNFDLAPPKPELWDFTLQIVRAFMDAFGFGATKILGHREVFERLGVPVQKSCPGRYFDIPRLRQEV